MAAFSSRGPGGLFLKPDITAPGVQILAGNTPTPDAVAGRPGRRVLPGHRRHVDVGPAHRRLGDPAAGAAPDLVARCDQVGDDDDGQDRRRQGGRGHAGRSVRLRCRAGRPHQGRRAPVVFEDSAANMTATGQRPADGDGRQHRRRSTCRPCRARVTRDPHGHERHRARLQVQGLDDRCRPGRRSRSSPSSGTIQARRVADVPHHDLRRALRPGQYFGQIRPDLARASPTLHLPVAFFNQQGDVTLEPGLHAGTVRSGTHDLHRHRRQLDGDDGRRPGDGRRRSAEDHRHQLRDDHGQRAATARPGRHSPGRRTPSRRSRPARQPAGGYLDLASFGIAPNAVGDEPNQNYNVPRHVSAGKTYTEHRRRLQRLHRRRRGNRRGATSTTCRRRCPTPRRPTACSRRTGPTSTATARPASRSATSATGDGVSSWIVVQWARSRLR